MELTIIQRTLKNSVIIILAFILVCFANACRDETKTLQTIDYSKLSFVKDEEINDKNFVDLGYRFIVRFSNVLLDLKGYQPVVIPIYKGTFGNVKDSQLRKKMKEKDVSITGSLLIETQPGKVKETIIDCVRFYKNSLLKYTDIEKPTIIGLEMSGMFIWYDFDYMGEPGTIMIGCGVDYDCENKPSKCMYRYLKDIEVNEKANMFGLSISIGSKSWWREKREKEGTWK
mgnify:CR=1 FL=1